MPKSSTMEVNEGSVPKGISTKTAENLMDCTKIEIKGSSRGHLLWRSLKNIRKYVTKVSEPLSKGRRRSLRRQLSFEVDDLERIILGVKPRQEETESASEISEDDDMKVEVEAIVKDAIDEASSAGKVVNVDYFENRMRQMEKECAELKKNMEELRRQAQEPKRNKSEKARNSFPGIHKSPHKTSRSGYGSDDHGYGGSMDFQMEQDDGKKNPCSVCGKLAVMSSWRCTSCRSFWDRLIRSHAKGKLLPRCDHWEPTVICKGCRRRKYETAWAIHAPNTPLGIPPCPPPACPVDADLIKEESREIRIEYW